MINDKEKKYLRVTLVAFAVMLSVAVYLSVVAFSRATKGIEASARRKGRIEAQSVAFRYIKHRIGVDEAVAYVDWLEELAEKAKP